MGSWTQKVLCLGERVDILHSGTRTVTKLAEICSCNLESEYDASCGRRLARKQEIKRHPWATVMVCCLVRWWCGCLLVSDDHRPSCACRQRRAIVCGRQGDGQKAGKLGLGMQVLAFVSHIITHLLHPPAHTPCESFYERWSSPARFTLSPRPKSLSRGFVIRAIGDAAPPSCRARRALLHGYRGIR
jgi:hypothetical protein